jgi:2-amino-4-hydroxy-6-hydroxymethyldihydropteridine diphosphokinase
LRELEMQNIRIRSVSTLIETMPFGVTSQPPFMNAVARIETAMSAEALMRALHMLERKAGRRRRKRWGPRTLDLDLLDYHSLIRRPARSSIKPLALPHPGLEQRIFVLAPLLEVAPRWRHPVSHQLAALTLRKLYRLEQS